MLYLKKVNFPKKFKSILSCAFVFLIISLLTPSPSIGQTPELKMCGCYCGASHVKGITGTVTNATQDVGDMDALVACYGVLPCGNASALDVTALATWSEEAANNTVSAAYSNSIYCALATRSGILQEALNPGVETITMTYNGETVMRQIAVNDGVCLCDGKCESGCPPTRPDPDCACQDNNGCCGITSCDYTNDNDCPSVACVWDGCNGTCPPNCLTPSDDPDCGSCLDGDGICCLDSPSGCSATNDSDCAGICMPDECNQICPPGCTGTEDPDCGCIFDDGCCGIVGCTAISDNDCPAACQCTRGDDCCSDDCNFDPVNTSCGTPSQCWSCDAAGNCLAGFPDQANFTLTQQCNYSGEIIDRSGTNLRITTSGSIRLRNNSELYLDRLRIDNNAGDTVFIEGNSELLFGPGPACVNVCSPEGTWRCSEASQEQCILDSGCLAWGNTQPCPDNKCWEPDCDENGIDCAQNAVGSGGTDEACFGNTGCAGADCRCNGLGGCVSMPGCTGTCSTGPGCLTSAPANAVATGDICCGAGEVCFDCQAGYTWNGSSCVAVNYSCTGSIPVNADTWDAEEMSGLLVDTPWTYSASDTGTKCQYHCDAGYTWNAGTGTCVLPACVSTCPAGGPGCRTSAIANSHVTGDVCCGAGESCYACNAGYPWDGSQCGSYSCTGSIPSHAQSWGAGEETGLTMDTPWHYSASNTVQKCEFMCSPSYTWDGNSCELNCHPGVCIDSFCSGTNVNCHDDCGDTYRKVTCYVHCDPETCLGTSCAGNTCTGKCFQVCYTGACSEPPARCQTSVIQTGPYSYPCSGCTQGPGFCICH